MTILDTPRLRLEPMCDAHFDGLFAMNSDPDVMRYITGRPDTEDDTWAMIERVQERWARYGFSWWSFIEKSSGEIIGAGCIQYLGREPSNPHETGWRLRKDKWGQGFASEAAQRMAAFAFEELEVPLLCAVCDPANKASSHVMEKLGMRYVGDETWYEMLCARYQMTREEWLKARAVRTA